ncbi:hypothetical protein [Leptospira vanthielii]|uniref:ATP-binding protein n=1 Tax=Leptospira vanthielii TaxID=293085 RepID=A0ABY2NTV4_9LEPT|nr:hypothetical protein [Leptospira vanthielii]TGM61521.1 hypothetical protein EHQ95_01840 [Leptospira vanthielii]
MSEKGSAFQKGGGGTNFEQLVQTAFLTTLIIRGNVPCISSGELTEIALQVTNRGYETDDFMVTAQSVIGEHRLLFQVKHDLPFTADNKKFKEVITAFWKDYNNISIFDKTKDKLIVVKNGLTKDERNHLKSILNWAKNHATESDFISEVNRIKAKRDKLDVFSVVLKEVNNNTALSDIELWEFLKCVDVLEYDFLNEGSVDKTYFLNLIRICKSKNSNATEREIWDSILAYVVALNPEGGSITLQSIKDKDFFRHFDHLLLNPYYKAVEKLKSDSKEILRPIKTSIGKGENEFQLARTEMREKILECLSISQLTIVTGTPGVGKSAEIKKILNKDFPNASVFVFRADQFNESTLANVFSSQGVNEKILDIFSCISLIPEKIIFIDSLEKLLEADPECAFKQLLALLKEHPEIKFIASSRKYAIDLIVLKFGIDRDFIDIVNIQTLGEEELKLVSEKFPQLNNVLKNKKIKNLLKSPKYLDFSILAISKTNDNYANASLTEFKENLWNSLVVDSANTKNGLPIKREDAFMEIALKRAKEMKLFIRPDKSDAEAIACLENDEIVFQENNNRRYSPTHDILEDWALVRYVSTKFENFPNPKDLFSNLGNEPAIRRAFRLWVEDCLIDNGGKINELIKTTISDQMIDKYWADELLIAVFKSENSSSIFTVFEKELISDNAVLLNRCLHIIKTCCKESDQKANNNDLLLPFGSGWKEAMKFIQNHISQLDEIKLSIVSFITDWYLRLLLQYNEIDDDELESAKSIVLFYLNDIEAGNEFWEDENVKNKKIDLITILFDLAEISKDEITQLIYRALKNEENHDSWRLNSFYKTVIEGFLSGIGNHRLIQNLPELIVDTAWKNWKYNPPKKIDFPDDELGLSYRHSLNHDECWGIEYGHSFFPSGIYKTPVYNLLRAHPKIGLNFILEFINYSVEFYIKASCEYKHNFSQINIELNNGFVVQKWAGWELWAAYRGSSVTNYLLESLLMSFEKFLLDMAGEKSDVSKKNLKFIFDYVIRNSNNVAPLSVLISVAFAYPEEIEEEVLPLLSVREFYEWDLNRAVNERVALSPQDNRIPFAQGERWESNQLPHRIQYVRGLLDFIVYYQFNIKNLNPQIFGIFDKLKEKSLADDVIWKKHLNEIDIRNWEAKPVDDNLREFFVQPIYEKEVPEYIDSKKEYFESQNISFIYAGIVSKAYNGEEVISFEKWSEIQKFYRIPDNLNFYYGNPASLSVIGLRDFSMSLTEEQKEWCLIILFHTINLILQDKFSMSYNLNRQYNIIEKEIALSSFHLLMKNAEHEDDKNSIVATMIFMLIAPFQNYEMNKITQYFREIFFRQFPHEAKTVWLGLIKYSIYKKENQKFLDYHDEERYKKAKIKEEKFVQKISSDKNIKLELSEISLDRCSGNLLARAFIATPFDSDDPDFLNFIIHSLSIVLNDLTKEEDYPRSGNRNSRNIEYESVSEIEKYIANLFLNADYNFSKSVLTTLVSSLTNYTKSQRYGRNDLVEFVNTTLDYYVLTLYDNGYRGIEQSKYKLQQTNFWNLWGVLFDLIPDDGNHSLVQRLLFDIRFLLWDDKGNPNVKDWSLLNGKREFYKKIFLEKGKKHVSSVINVLSTIGEREFLPEGISWLTEILKSNDNATLSLSTSSANRMIKRIFYNHIAKIKNDQTLIGDYIWILNKMVDLGSSDAYLLRENVITYKTNAA